MSSFKRGLDWTLLSLQRVPRAVSGACVLTGLVIGVTATSVVEIMPVGGRVVLFDSRSILHEIMPRTHGAMSIGWR